jgi:CBS domain-containing protein
VPLNTVRDIMLPLDEYVVVEADSTIFDALVALDDAQNMVSEGRAPHRAVLVRGPDGSILGKVGHQAFLAGLEPQYCDIGEVSALARAGLSKEFLKTIMQRMPLWKQGFDHYVRVSMNRRVFDIMHPVADESADIDENIRETIHKLISYNALSLVVTEHGKPVGIVRLADIFPVVTKLIRRRALKLQAE